MRSPGLLSGIAAAVSLSFVAACGAQWGPLAVVPVDGGLLARTEGTLVLTATCVFIERDGERMLLVWAADRTSWNPITNEISFRNPRGESTTVRSGQEVVLGGGAPDDDVATDKWAAAIDWVARPDPACVTDIRWYVSGLKVAIATPSGVT